MTIVDENHAPGRKRMVRANGRVNVYWVASPEAVKAGYRPRTVSLTDDPGDVRATPEIASRCQLMWQEMLVFLSGSRVSGQRSTLGTVAWLIDRYQSDENSPYRRIRQSTQPGYDRALKIVSADVGGRYLESIDANDIRKWFKLWGRADARGILKNPRRAYWCVQMLRIVVTYGKGLKNPACRELKEILTEAEFPIPKRRTQAMSPEQVTAIIAKAHELGLPNLARAIAIQFGCSLRQKDVIGEWIKAPGGEQWTSGLLWGEHIDAKWELTKPTSKSNFSEVAQFDLGFIPIVMAELSVVPPERRIGPVIVDERTGRPYRQREFARRFRDVARAAGVPDDIWNMDTRAGAVTHAYAKGAKPTDAMDLATHTQLSTNRGYARGRVEATSRVSILRFGPKKRDENERS